MNNNTMTIDELVKQFENNPSGGDSSQEPVEPIQQQPTDSPAAAANENPVPENFFEVFEDKFLKTDLLKTYALDEKEEQFFIPKTADEFAELLQANKEQWIAEARNEDKNALLEEVFQEATPALRFLAQNASKFSRVEDMLELAQSVNREEQLLSLDVSNPEHQEEIVRQALRIQGLDETTIEEEVEDLKNRNRLEIRAQKLKPSLDSYQANITAQILHQQDEENRKEQSFWRNYYNNFQTQLIDSRDIEGLKLRQEDKAKIAPLLLPSRDGSGLPIYHKIDEVVSKGDITTLSLISLILTDKESFYNLLMARDATKISGNLQKKLRSLATSTSSAEDIQQTHTKPQANNSNNLGVFM